MYVTINRILVVAQRLCDAGHYATPQIRALAAKLDKEWQTLASALEDRNTVLAMSVIFHKKAEEVCACCETFVVAEQLGKHTVQL